MYGNYSNFLWNVPESIYEKHIYKNKALVMFFEVKFVISLSIPFYSLQIEKFGCGIKQKSIDFKYKQNYPIFLSYFAGYYRFLFLDSGQKIHWTRYS